MKLLLDPDVDLDDTGRSGLRALRETHPTQPVHFGFYPADPDNPATPTCDRCGQTLHVHVWMLLADDLTTTDCELRGDR